MRKVIVPETAVQRIRSLGLNRAVAIDLYNAIHIDSLAAYEKFRAIRVHEHPDRLCRWDIVIAEDLIRHIFVLSFDDATSPDHLFLRNIAYQKQSG